MLQDTGVKAAEAAAFRSEASMDEWRELFAEAVAFKKLRPWQWLTDSDIFGVQDPKTGEIGYCCVLGRGGEVFGLNVYLGAEALQLLDRLREGDVAPYESMHMFLCLSVNFENRADLDKNDLALIKELGLKFRGANEWPAFRHYAPGLYPWHLSGDEVRFMTVALRQATETAQRLLPEAGRLTLRKKNAVLVRVPPSSAADAWEDRWLVPEPGVRRPDKTVYRDELRVRRLADQAGRKLGAWEAELLYAPFPVDGDPRPFYPLMCLIADQESGFIVCFHMFENGESDGQEALEEFLRAIEKTGGKPQKLFVRTSECADLFEHTAKQLKIKLERAARLYAVEEAWEGMYEHMG
ncbi:DUF7309 domain-containing protein [Paenibacillus hamazuiensis]|uniref:DUF7309 domain-containing protein n=1 Tax=Paenibacillus hamazuiensis TaxID=2936508 RepID=UPI00200BE0E4|nr:hypothetical protein [Paenibacillus hamazuiensis]